MACVCNGMTFVFHEGGNSVTCSNLDGSGGEQSAGSGEQGDDTQKVQSFMGKKEV